MRKGKEDMILSFNKNIVILGLVIIIIALSYIITLKSDINKSAMLDRFDQVIGSFIKDGHMDIGGYDVDNNSTINNIIYIYKGYRTHPAAEAVIYSKIKYICGD